MTDREMLQLAAKAAGYRVLDENVEGIDVCFERPGYLPVEIIGWNPRDDDGEAFRLAVRLRLHARQFPVLDDGMDEPLGMIEVWRTDDDDPLHVEYLKAGDDRLAATRLAITRAAAEIGKGMK